MSRVDDLSRIVGFPVSRETADKLATFESEFVRWNKRINLTSASTLKELWSRHILDSAQLARYAPQSAKRWVDIGSGGGLPGIVLAVLFSQTEFFLIESSNKKASFLRHVASMIAPNVTVHPHRIEDCYATIGQVDVVSARALASMTDLLRLSQPWLEGGAVGLFHKGRDYAREIAESRTGWQFDLVERVSLVESTSRVIEVSNLKSSTMTEAATDHA